jgi:hypothetical protein
MESEFAPHLPAALPYKAKLAFLKNIDDVADDLADDPDYQALAERIASRFSEPDEMEGFES